MNILITAPSLDTTKNVSGIATVVNITIQNNINLNYYHYLLGSPDQKLSKVHWFMCLLKQLFLFPLFVKKNNIKLVHQNLPFDAKGVLREYFISLWCRLMSIPVVLHIHGGNFLMNETKSTFFRYLSNSLFKNSCEVVVLSDLEKIALQEKYNYSFAKVLSNSVDCNIYRMKNRQLHKGKPTLLFLGRIHESKGVNEIYEAFKLLKSKRDFKFILCGTGPLKEKFVDAFNNLLGADFEYQGIVMGDSKIDVIKRSDFFLLPSRYGEGLPMALLETMAAGVVPIVTDDASMKYIVNHRNNGIRVNKYDPIDLFEKLDYTFGNFELISTMSKNAAQTIEEKYDVKSYIMNLNVIYSGALARFQ